MRVQFSAVLLNWKRPHNLPAIYKSILAVPRIREILVWDNSSRLPPESDRRIRVITSPSNLVTLGRFKAIESAACEAIYTQDDDYVVNDIEDILDQYEASPQSIVASLTRGHMMQEGNGKKPWLQLGWGSAFSASAVDVLQYYVDAYGEDEVLNRKADRIFTILHGNHICRYASATPLTDPRGGKSESSADSLFRRRDHYDLTNTAAKRALEIRDAVSA